MPVVTPEQYPLLIVEDLLQEIRGKFFYVMDLRIPIADKCVFDKSQPYLVYIVSEDGIKRRARKIQALARSLKPEFTPRFVVSPA